MAYDVPYIETYQWTDSTFGATAVTHQIIGPKGRVGIVRDITVDVTTSLVGTTSVPEIMVGTASGNALYGRYRLGTAIGTGYGVGIRRASQEASIIGNPPRTSNLFSAFVVLDGGPLASSDSSTQKTNATLTGRIPVDTAIIVTAQLGVGGSPAGGGHVRVVIEWVGGNVPAP